jgi:hypothetical protein
MIERVYYSKEVAGEDTGLREKYRKTWQIARFFYCIKCRPIVAAPPQKRLYGFTELLLL